LHKHIILQQSHFSNITL